jgi:N-acylneuraminate cytidylyltransferase
MALTAVIPVRAGSTRVKDKNIKKFANSSLLEIKIEQLKNTRGVDRIIVSTDSEKMIQIAREHDVVAKRRPDEYCDEKSRSFNEVVRYIADNEVDTETMMWVPCVCPLISCERIEEGIHVYHQIEKKAIKNDSVATAALFKEYLFDEKGPLNFSVAHHVTSQCLPNWHYITNGFFIAKTINMSKWGFVYGLNPYLLEVNKFEAIDIDDEYDFEMAEFAYNCINGREEMG